MAEFLPAWDVLLEHEGGYVNNPRDSGGPTKYGICLPFAKSLEGSIDLNHDGVVDEKDIALLTKEEAQEIYRAYFWAPNGLQELREQRVATKMLDLEVHLGSRRGNRLAQRVLRALGWDIPADGYCGPRTVLALNSVPEQRLLLRLCEEQARTYRDIVEACPAKSEFLKNWLKRARWPFPHLKETT